MTFAMDFPGKASSGGPICGRPWIWIAEVDVQAQTRNLHIYTHNTIPATPNPRMMTMSNLVLVLQLDDPITQKWA
jgi:hypothetical protein